MKSFKKYLLLLLGAVLLFPSEGVSQISIAPTTLYLDNQNRFATMLVLNGSEQQQEVSIEFDFGYLRADSLGNTQMTYEDSLAEEENSIAGRILGFPRSFTLQPNQRQVVRLTVRNTGDLPDGTYWTRIRTISNPVSPSIDQQTEEGISAQINFRFEQITSAFYKKGDVSTGLEITGRRVEVNRETDTGEIILDVAQTGNSPYIGQVTLQILSPEGEIITESLNSVAIFFDTIRKVRFDASEMPPGRYTADLLFETSRPNLEDAQLVQADPISYQFDFGIE